MGTQLSRPVPDLSNASAPTAARCSGAAPAPLPGSSWRHKVPSKERGCSLLPPDLSAPGVHPAVGTLRPPGPACSRSHQSLLHWSPSSALGRRWPWKPHSHSRGSNSTEWGKEYRLPVLILIQGRPGSQQERPWFGGTVSPSAAPLHCLSC